MLRYDRAYRDGIIFGLYVGVLCLILGFVLIILGVSGSIDLIVEAGGIKSKMINATPGSMFSLFGLIILWKYKPKITERTIIETKEKQPKTGIETTITKHHSVDAGMLSDR